MSLPTLPDPEKPTSDVLSTLGDVLFLAMRSKSHSQRSLETLRWWWEPPAHLKQVWVFKIDGVPRAAVCWAMLNNDSQHRYVVDRTGLKPQDWRNGDIPWVIDILTPYKSHKLENKVIRWIMESGFKGQPFRFMRMDDDGNIRRIAEARARADGGKDFKLLQLEQL